MRARWRWLIAGGLVASLALLNTFAPWRKPVEAQVLTLGGFTGSTYSVTSFATVQAALDFIPDGSRLYFPSTRGPWIPPDTSGWQIRKSVEIFSDGMHIGEDVGFQPSEANGCIFQLRGSMGRDFYLHDAVISNNSGMPAASKLGDYVRIASPDTLLERIRIERVWMLYAGRSGIYIPATGGLHTVGVFLRDVQIQGCGGHGLYMNKPALLTISGCNFTQNGGMGAVLVAAGNGVSISGSNFENNGYRLDGASDVTIPEDFGVTYNAQLYMVSSDGIISGNNIEATADADSVDCRHGITLNQCRGVVIGGNEIDGTATVINTKGINMLNTTTGCTILANNHSAVKWAVYIQDTPDAGNVVLMQNVLSPNNYHAGLVNIPAGSYNFAVIGNQSLTGARNKVAAILLPALATNGGVPDSLTGTNGVYSGILQGGLLAFGTGDSLYVRRATGSGWKLVQ